MKNHLSIIAPVLTALLACTAPEGPDTTLCPVTVTVLAKAQAATTYRITITGNDMSNIGPREYAGGQTIELYVPEGKSRRFHFERYNGNGVLIDTGTTLRDIGPGLNEVSVTMVSTIVPPAITSHPVNKLVTEGQQATFSVTATGSVLNYQWQKGAIDIPGANSATYTTPVTKSSDSNSIYRCVVSNPYSIVISNNAILDVVKLAVAPGITSHPANQMITEGQTGSFSITATGTDLKYQWQKGATNIPGATSATYTTAPVTLNDNNALYRCVVSNSAGSLTSNAAILNVTQMTVAPGITSHPVNQTVTEGQTATFSITAYGTDLKFQWQKNNSDIPGAIIAMYTTPTTTRTDDNSIYRCVISNAAGNLISNAATLTVVLKAVAPGITNHPVNQSVTEGQTATFSIAATGTDLRFQWQKGTMNIPGAVISTYTTPPTSTTDNNSTYQCIVSNSAGSITSNSALLGVVKKAVFPEITSHPVNQSVTEGQTATFTVTAIGTDLMYQWQKGPNDIPGATSPKYTTLATTISDNNIVFRCVVRNSAGNVRSNDARLTVVQKPLAPFITTHPVDQSVMEGQTATFSVTANGTDLTFQWQKGSVDIPGAITPMFTTQPNMIGNNNSTYRCIVKNSAGTQISNAALLTVNSACGSPAINTQPKNQTVTAGDPATFTVIASGTDLTFQWRKNGTNIPGVNSPIYTISSTAITDTGFYSCYISNYCGNVASFDARLVICAVPAIITQPADRTVLSGTPVTFSVEAAGTDLTYQWRKDGADISGANASDYSISTTALTDTGTYKCFISNGCGTTTSFDARLIICTMPAIINQPSDETIIAGSPVTFTVNASGTSLTYQWRKNGTDISGENSSTYTISSTVPDDSGMYSCYLSNVCGNTTSWDVRLTVCTMPAIITQPVDQSIPLGNPVTFTVDAAGTNLAYQWRKNWTDISGANASYYSISSLAITDTGAYSCYIANACGNLHTTDARLTICMVPALLTQPADQTVTAGNPVTFAVATSGTSLTYQWRKDGTDISGANDSIYSISSTVTTDNGSYSCYISNGCGTMTSWGAILTVTNPTNDSVTDIDGNVYHVVTIGTQTWMKENLRTTRYNDGSTITFNSSWVNATTEAYCYYNNTTDADSIRTYGALYNWHAVNTQKLAPAGWHVPSDAEWSALTTALGGESVAGGKLKEAGMSHWNSPNLGATNETGFSALPGGHRKVDGTCYGIGDYGDWWSATETDAASAQYHGMYYSDADVYHLSSSKDLGFSVRCVRD